MTGSALPQHFSAADPAVLFPSRAASDQTKAFLSGPQFSRCTFYASPPLIRSHALLNVDVSSPSFSDFSELQKPLDHFRAKTKRLKIHPLESLLLWVVSAHLVFLPWAIGGMSEWAQWISLGFAVLGFGVSLIPRSYTEEETGSNVFRLVMWPRLAKFPIWWLGLALLALVTIQGLNPAWRFETDGKGWWLRAIPSTAWLPTGVDVPFERGGPWRMLLIYSSVLLTSCSLWVGFTRRRVLQTLFIVLATNGVLLAGFGIAQRLLGNGKIFWFYDSPNSSYFSSFIYKNHGGTYLVLSLAVTCGLAAWYYLRGLRRMEKSNPAGLFAFFATCIAIAILISYARGATITMLGYLTVCVVVFIGHQLMMKNTTRKPLVAVVLMIVFGFFLKTGLEALNSREAWTRLKAGMNREDMSLDAREWATSASVAMLKDNWQGGIGAGSFRLLFPIYQHRDPRLSSRPQFWEHAHNDIVQTPIELGLTGIVLLMAMGGYLLFALSRSFFWENPLSGCTVLGIGGVVAYAWWDFPFQCPAILLTWCVLGIAVTLWTRFEEMNVRG